MTRKKRKGRRKNAEAALRAPPDESRPRCANNAEKRRAVDKDGSTKFA